VRTIAQIVFACGICIAATSMSEAQDQPASTVLSLKTADEGLRDMTDQYRDIVGSIKKGSSEAWKRADELSRQAAKSEDTDVHVAAIGARKVALEEKLLLLADVVDMEQPLRDAFEKFKGELDTRIQSHSARLEASLRSKSMDVSDLTEAVSLTKRVEELLGTEESILQMLESQQLSDEEVELVEEFGMEIRSLMTSIKLAKQSEATQTGLLKELNLLRLTRSLEHLEMQRGIKQSKLTKKNLARLLHNDRLMLETVGLQDTIRKSLSNRIPVVDVPLDDLVPETTKLPKGTSAEEIVTRYKMQGIPKPKTGPSSTDIQQFLETNTSNGNTGDKQ